MNKNESTTDRTRRTENQAADSGMGELLFKGLLLGTAIWLGGKAVKAEMDRAQGGGAANGMGLPAEFGENRSRPSTEIPGQPQASAMAALQREMEKRQHAVELGRMMTGHMRNMNRIRLRY